MKTSHPPRADASRPLVRLHKVPAILGIGDSTMYRLIRDGEYPEPIRVGVRGRAYTQDQIDSILERRGK